MTTTFWGKRRTDGSIHPLTDHCIDVAIVLRALLDLPNLARQLVKLSPIAKDRLAVVAFLHDFGKCNRGFQAKANPNARDTAGHVMEAVALLNDFQDLWPPQWRNLLEKICTWFAQGEGAAMQMLLAAISHHGRPVSERDYQASTVRREFWQKRGYHDPAQGLVALAQAARAAFPNAFSTDSVPIDANPSLQQRFAGLVMLADWIGSDTQFFPFRTSPDEDRLAFARQEVEHALKAIGLVPPLTRQPRAFQAVFGFAPSPLQAAILDEIDPDDATRLLLIESNTGSGKTEAALAWFFRLYAEGKVDGLYFALPTRVAARELYTRVRKAVDAAFESDTRPSPVLLAVPGYVKASGQVVLPEPTGTLWDDRTDDQRRERLWSAERPKRFLAAPIAVGTIDQALLSALQVKHSLLRSVCLDRHLLVVDEVHASDPYMREVLCALLEGHLERGGWALLLSATLGESAAARFFGREPNPLAVAVKKPYPLITTRDQDHPLASVRNREVEVAIAPTITDDATLIEELIPALHAWARVLVICNTVSHANALFRRVEKVLSEQHPELLQALFSLSGVRCPHHGRFAREDRELLDAAVTAVLGKNSHSGARLLIGTQTLEQSLDIDADWLVTDLAPMDVLLQRIGRLHRHDRLQRPAAFATPRVLVRAPEKALVQYLQKDGELRAPAGLGSVYRDGRVLACTWAELAKRQVLRLPEEARLLIEHTTHPSAWETLPDVWHSHGNLIEGKEMAEIRQALRSVLEDKPFGELHYVDKGERVLTRLGDPTFDLPLAKPLPSPFGVTIESIAIPARWLGGGISSDIVEAEPTSSGFQFAIGKQKFTYTRFGLEKDHVRPAS
jgi:CRISPR-associated endonuclease/helicase Cas3